MSSAVPSSNLPLIDPTPSALSQICLKTRAEADLLVKLLSEIINSNIISYEFRIRLPFDGALDSVRNENSDACIDTYFKLIFVLIKALKFIYSMLSFFYFSVLQFRPCDYRLISSKMAEK